MLDYNLSYSMFYDKKNKCTAMGIKSDHVSSVILNQNAPSTSGFLQIKYGLSVR